MEQSVSVAQAAQDMLESKKDRLRPVSLKGLRTLTGKLLRDRPDLARRQVRGLDAAVAGNGSTAVSARRDAF